MKIYYLRPKDDSLLLVGGVGSAWVESNDLTYHNWLSIVGSIIEMLAIDGIVSDSGLSHCDSDCEQIIDW